MRKSKKFNQFARLAGEVRSATIDLDTDDVTPALALRHGCILESLRIFADAMDRSPIGLRRDVLDKLHVLAGRFLGDVRADRRLSIPLKTALETLGAAASLVNSHDEPMQPSEIRPTALRRISLPDARQWISRSVSAVSDIEGEVAELERDGRATLQPMVRDAWTIACAVTVVAAGLADIGRVNAVSVRKLVQIAAEACVRIKYHAQRLIAVDGDDFSNLIGAIDEVSATLEGARSLVEIAAVSTDYRFAFPWRVVSHGRAMFAVADAARLRPADFVGAAANSDDNILSAVLPTMAIRGARQIGALADAIRWKKSC